MYLSAYYVLIIIIGFEIGFHLYSHDWPGICYVDQTSLFLATDCCD